MNDRRNAPMKNALDFNIPFSSSGTHGGLDFINCFASAVVFLEIGDKFGGDAVPCKIHHRDCIGCCVNCIDSPPAQHARWFYLFQAMSGASCVRRRYDGKPSEMQRLIGDCDGQYFGNDNTADFLFGFAGYGFRKLTDPAGFKAAIMESIDAGKPVIAKAKTSFHVVTGYDGDALITPDFVNGHDNTKIKGASEYGEIEALFLFGEKTAPRYTLRDGLERIRRMFELNESEKIWDEYTVQMRRDISDRNDEEYNALTPDEQKAFMKNLKDAAAVEWTTHGLGQAFAGRQHEEMRNPALYGIWNRMDNLTGAMNEIGFAVYFLDSKVDWSELKHFWDRNGICGMIRAGVIEQYKTMDAELLGLIQQAIDIMSQ